VVAILGSVLWFRGHAAEPHRAATMPALATQAAAARATSIQTNTSAVGAATTPANNVDPTLVDAKALKAPAKPLLHKHVSPSAPSAPSVPSAPSAVLAPSPSVSADAKPPAAVSTAGDLGQSTLIESLIERRH
jgi:hypothetical protein